DVGVPEAKIGRVIRPKGRAGHVQIVVNSPVLLAEEGDYFLDKILLVLLVALASFVSRYRAVVPRLVVNAVHAHYLHDLVLQVVRESAYERKIFVLIKAAHRCWKGDDGATTCAE